MLKSTRCYRHSGLIGFSGIILMPFFGLLSAVIGGWVYGFLLFFIPYVYFHILLVIGLGVLIGYAVGLGAKKGKARNTLMPTLIGLVAGVVGYYVGWVSWIFAGSKQAILAWRPETLWGVVMELSRDGVWSIFGFTPKGWVLLAIWALELLIICGIAANLSTRLVASAPFCERCEKWCERIEESPMFAVPDDIPAFLSQVEQGEFGVFTELETTHATSSVFALFEFSGCPRCEKERFLTGKIVQVDTDSEGEEKRKEIGLFENFIVTEEVQDAIASTWFPKLVD